MRKIGRVPYGFVPSASYIHRSPYRLATATFEMRPSRSTSNSAGPPGMPESGTGGLSPLRGAGWSSCALQILSPVIVSIAIT